MTTSELTEIEFTVEPGDVDEERFASIWNIASATMGGDTVKARMIASKVLGFLCKHRCEFVIATPTDAKYLDEWYERNHKLLHDWSPESDKVDVISQHCQVPFETFVEFLQNKKFSIEKNYSPRRADRLAWFTDDWNVG